jgi:hypothetical protein
MVKGWTNFYSELIVEGSAKTVTNCFVDADRVVRMPYGVPRDETAIDGVFLHGLKASTDPDAAGADLDDDSYWMSDEVVTHWVSYPNLPTVERNYVTGSPAEKALESVVNLSSLG